MKKQAPETAEQTLDTCTVLVVDDEIDILELVEYNLSKAGLEVETVETGEEAIQLARSIFPDAIVLDLMLPGVDGLEVCRRLKADDRTREIPILMLSAKGEESDVVTGLNLGADDYVVKPFSPRVLVARVQAVLRRRDQDDPSDDEVIRIGELLVHPGRHEITVQGDQVALTYTEFGILRLLAKRRGWVFTRSQIVEAVQGQNVAVTDRSVDVHIVSLRRKLRDYGKLIETVRGVGYRLKDA